MIMWRNKYYKKKKPKCNFNTKMFCTFFITKKCVELKCVVNLNFKYQRYKIK